MELGVRSPREDVNHGYQLLATMWVFLGIAITLVVIRLMVRFRQRKAYFDDLLLVISLGLAIYGAVCRELETGAGFGRHIEFLSPIEIQNISKWSALADQEYKICMFFVKMSISWSLLGLVKNEQRWLKVAIVANTAIVAVYTTVIIFLLSLRCLPFDAIWDSHLHRDCFSTGVFSRTQLAYGILDSISNFILATTPLLLVPSPSMELGTFIWFIIFVSLGYFVSALAIVRTATAGYSDNDITWNQIPYAIWTELEQLLTIICAAMSALYPLVPLIDDTLAYLRPGGPTTISRTSSRLHGTHAYAERIRRLSLTSTKAKDTRRLRHKLSKSSSQRPFASNRNLHNAFREQEPAVGRMPTIPSQAFINMTTEVEVQLEEQRSPEGSEESPQEMRETGVSMESAERLSISQMGGWQPWIDRRVIGTGR